MSNKTLFWDRQSVKRETLLKNAKRYTRESQTSAHGDSVGDDRGRFRCKDCPQPQSYKQQKKGKIFTALAHGLEAFWKCFSVSPFLLPQLLSNQPSLPPPPASLDTHTPSNTDLPPTHTPPNHFFPLFLCWKGSMTSLFLSFTFRLSVYQLILAWPPREE